MIFSTSFDNGIYFYIFYRTKFSSLVPSELVRYLIVYLLLAGITFVLYKYFHVKSPEFAKGILWGWGAATFYLILVLGTLFVIGSFGFPLS